MEKIKLTKISHYDKDRDNKPLINRNNKPYTRCLIVDDKGRRISGFGSAITQAWGEGDMVELEITQNGNYLNFKIPNQNVTRQEFDILTKKVKFCKDEIGFLHKKFEGLDLKNKVEEIDLGPEPGEEVEAI